jgi:hypothetical protein
MFLVVHRCFWRVASRETITKGDIYQLEPDVFRSTEVFEGETVAAIVLARGGYGQHPEVLGLTDGAETYVTDRQPCSNDAVQQAVSMGVAGLKGP